MGMMAQTEMEHAAIRLKQAEAEERTAREAMNEAKATLDAAVKAVKALRSEYEASQILWYDEVQG